MTTTPVAVGPIAYSARVVNTCYRLDMIMCRFGVPAHDFLYPRAIYHVIGYTAVNGSVIHPGLIYGAVECGLAIVSRTGKSLAQDRACKSQGHEELRGMKVSDRLGQTS